MAASRAYQRIYRQKNKTRLAEYSKNYWQKTKARHQELGRQWLLQKRYGLTPEDYKNLLVMQGFACAVCRVEQKTLKRRLVIDHSHKTGKVRGLLCNPCNNKRVDTVENFGHLIPRIVEYLKRGE